MLALGTGFGRTWQLEAWFAVGWGDAERQGTGIQGGIRLGARILPGMRLGASFSGSRIPGRGRAEATAGGSGSSYPGLYFFTGANLLSIDVEWDLTPGSRRRRRPPPTSGEIAQLRVVPAP
jgi:hypothetical protein